MIVIEGARVKPHRYYCRYCKLNIIRGFTNPPDIIICDVCGLYARFRKAKPSKLRQAAQRIIENLKVLRDLRLGKYNPNKKKK